jgi:hypothetical protein
LSKAQHGLHQQNSLNRSYINIKGHRSKERNMENAKIPMMERIEQVVMIFQQLITKSMFDRMNIPNK